MLGPLGKPVLLLLIISAFLPLEAQRESGQALPRLVHANEQFGAKLLASVHAGDPDKNVAISPLSLTLVFAALQTDLYDGAARKEIDDAFGWGEYPSLNVPSRMLLGAFEEPEDPPKLAKKRSEDRLLPRVPARPPEGVWITNTLLYRGSGTISTGFKKDARKYFGVNIASSGDSKPTGADLRQTGHSAKTLPAISGESDVLISSRVHLQSAWSGNAFSMSTPYQSSFRSASGNEKQVRTLDSELEVYPYAKTDEFEAVELSCSKAYMVAVLPAPGRSLKDVERLIVEQPNTIDVALKKRIGIVSMPIFHFRYEANLRSSFEQLGIKAVFNDLGPIINIPKSHLSEVSQGIDIKVDQQGILADAESVVGAIYGGILSGQNAFHMQLDRPFLFLIRDNNTDALLFAGVVADPSQE